MSVSEVHIEISVNVREKLRLSPERKAIVDDLFASLNDRGVPIMVPSRGLRVYIHSRDGYVFLYRELTPRELARSGQSAGYYVFDMKAGPQWIKAQLGG